MSAARPRRGGVRGQGPTAGGGRVRWDLRLRGRGSGPPAVGAAAPPDVSHSPPGPPSRVHITEATLSHLDKAYEVEDGHGQQRDSYLKEMNIRTYLVIDPRVRGLRRWGGDGLGAHPREGLCGESGQGRRVPEAGLGPVASACLADVSSSPRGPWGGGRGCRAAPGLPCAHIGHSPSRGRQLVLWLLVSHPRGSLRNVSRGRPFQPRLGPRLSSGLARRPVSREPRAAREPPPASALPSPAPSQVTPVLILLMSAGALS